MPFTFYDPSNANESFSNVNLIYTFKELTLPKQNSLMKTENVPCALRGQPNGRALSCGAESYAPCTIRTKFTVDCEAICTRPLLAMNFILNFQPSA